MNQIFEKIKKQRKHRKKNIYWKNPNINFKLPDKLNSKRSAHWKEEEEEATKKIGAQIHTISHLWQIVYNSLYTLF